MTTTGTTAFTAACPTIPAVTPPTTTTATPIATTTATASAHPAAPIRLYRHRLSGHSHRAELMLSLLGLPFERVEIDLLAGEHRQPPHLARNLIGQVPVIEDGDQTISDSNAILVYLARRYAPGSHWLPDEPRQAAEVQRWFGLSAGMLSEGPGLARVEVVFGRPQRDPRRPEVAARLFTAMQTVLSGQDFLVGDRPTLADIAMYTYTSHAPEGGIALTPYPAIQRWLARIEALPGYVGMHRSA